MTRTRTALLAAAALVAASSGFVASSAWSQDQGEAAEMLKKWKEAATPGAKHKLLDRFVGTWTTTTTVWSGGRAMGPGEKGEATHQWSLGGRFVETRGKGTLFGMPADSIGYWGYDNFRKHYVATFLSSQSTAILHAEGIAERDDSALQMYGTLDEFLDGTVAKNVRYTLRFPSADRIVMEIHDLDIGERDTKVVEMTFDRKQ